MESSAALTAPVEERDRLDDQRRLAGAQAPCKLLRRQDDRAAPRAAGKDVLAAKRAYPRQPRGSDDVAVPECDPGAQHHLGHEIVHVADLLHGIRFHDVRFGVLAGIARGTLGARLDRGHVQLEHRLEKRLHAFVADLDRRPAGTQVANQRRNHFRQPRLLCRALLDGDAPQEIVECLHGGRPFGALRAVLHAQRVM